MNTTFNYKLTLANDNVLEGHVTGAFANKEEAHASMKRANPTAKIIEITDLAKAEPPPVQSAPKENPVA